jgi:hypothetical protein
VYSEIRAAARRRHRQLLERVRSALSRDEDANFGELTSELDSLARFAALRSPQQRMLIAATPLLVAVVALAPLWFLRHPSPQVVLSARASRVVVALASAHRLEIEGVRGVTYLRLEGLASVESDLGHGDVAIDHGSGSAFVEGSVNIARIVLEPLDSAPGPSRAALRTVAISHRNGLATLDVEGYRATVRANVEEPTRLLVLIGGSVKEDTLADASLEFRGPSAPPARTRLFFNGPDQPMRLPILRPRHLRLRETAFDDLGETVSFSSVTGGTIILVDTGRKHEILRGAALVLGDLNGDLRLELTNEGVAVDYHGGAGVLGLGEDPEHIEADLRPSIA